MLICDSCQQGHQLNCLGVAATESYQKGINGFVLAVQLCRSCSLVAVFCLKALRYCYMVVTQILSLHKGCYLELRENWEAFSVTALASSELQRQMSLAPASESLRLQYQFIQEAQQLAGPPEPSIEFTKQL